MHFKLPAKSEKEMDRILNLLQINFNACDINNKIDSNYL